MNALSRLTAFGVVFSLVLSAAPPCGAEVSAQTDALGQYVGTYVFCSASSRSLNVWEVQRTVAGRHPLNSDGDTTGDLWPVIAENPVDRNHPWVVWSRFNGFDFDLVWSRWLGDDWAPIDWVHRGASPGDDMDPGLAFDVDGRPYMVWWQIGEDGTGQILLSVFLVTRWMEPFWVSDPAVDSRNPTVEILEDGTIRVRFESPDGEEERLILFRVPDSINDDITPLGHLEMEEVVELE